MPKIIEDLVRERNKLLKLAKQQARTERIKIQSTQEEKMLKREINELKMRTKRNFLTKVKRITLATKRFATSPRTKKELQLVKKRSIRIFKAIQKFADKHG